MKIIGNNKGDIKFSIFIYTCLSKVVLFLENKDCIEYYKPIFSRNKTTLTMLENNNIKSNFFWMFNTIIRCK